MKKFILTAAMGVLLFVGLTSMTQMKAPNYDCQGYCAYYAAYFSSHGACTSMCKTCTNSGQGAGVIANCLCKFYGDLGAPNHGECVLFIKSLVNGGGGQ